MSVQENMITYEYSGINDDIIVIYGCVLDPTPHLRSYICCTSTHVLTNVALSCAYTRTHIRTGKEYGIVVPQHEFDALLQGVQHRKIIMRFQQLIITAYNKKARERSQKSKVRFGEGSTFPLSHTQSPSLLFFI